MEENVFIKLVDFKRNLEREVSNYAKNEVPKILILSYKPGKYKKNKIAKLFLMIRPSLTFWEKTLMSPFRYLLTFKDTATYVILQYYAIQ